jgi:hypothetical protein
MKLLDTIEGDLTFLEEHPHAPLLREDRKLKASQDVSEQIRRLERIRKIVVADPKMVFTAMECMFSFKTQNRELALELREVLLDCLIHMIQGTAPMDPELCTRAMDILAEIDFPNDRAFLHEMDKILLKDFPYSYTVHHQIQKRRCKTDDQVMLPAEKNLVGARTFYMLKVAEQKTGTVLLNGTEIDVEACKVHDDLPADLLGFAAHKDLTGDSLAALSIFVAMERTMQKRPLFNEYAPFLVAYKELLRRCGLAFIHDERQTSAFQDRIDEVDQELAFITGGWHPTFPGTQKIQKMLKSSEGQDYVGAPLYRHPTQLAAAFKRRLVDELPN